MMKSAVVALYALVATASLAWAGSSRPRPLNKTKPPRPSRALRAKYRHPVSPAERDTLLRYFESYETEHPSRYRRINGVLYLYQLSINDTFRVAPGALFVRLPQGVPLDSIMARFKQSDVPRAAEFKVWGYGKRESTIHIPLRYPKEMDPLEVIDAVKRTGLFEHVYTDYIIRVLPIENGSSSSRRERRARIAGAATSNPSPPHTAQRCSPTGSRYRSR
jgi:hypothetical protein